MTEQKFDSAELKNRLTEEQYQVTQNAGTEQAFSGAYWDSKADGIYKCVVCSTELFSSSTKYDSGTGWPSFFEALEGDRVETKTDKKFGMVRTEARCSSCDAHIGHVFADGPGPGGERYCIRCAAASGRRRRRRNI